MLSGEPPFYHEDNFELFELIKGCKYTMDKPIWQHISEEAKDFIRKLLVADPNKRITAAEIQSHPWITNQVKTGKQVNVLEKMREWETKRKLENKNSQKKQDADGDSDD